MAQRRSGALSFSIPAKPLHRPFMSRCYDLLDVCKTAERRWASAVLRRELAGGDEAEVPLPPLEAYEAAVARRVG